MHLEFTDQDANFLGELIDERMKTLGLKMLLDPVAAQTLKDCVRFVSMIQEAKRAELEVPQPTESPPC